MPITNDIHATCVLSRNTSRIQPPSHRKRRSSGRCLLLNSPAARPATAYATPILFDTKARPPLHPRGWRWRASRALPGRNPDMTSFTSARPVGGLRARETSCEGQDTSPQSEPAIKAKPREGGGTQRIRSCRRLRQRDPKRVAKRSRQPGAGGRLGCRRSARGAHVGAAAEAIVGSDDRRRTDAAMGRWAWTRFRVAPIAVRRGRVNGRREGTGDWTAEGV
jgi:hypothetical protein